MSNFADELFLLVNQHEHYRSRLGASFGNESAKFLDNVYSQSRQELVLNVEVLREIYETDRTNTNVNFRRKLAEVIDSIAAIREAPFNDAISLAESNLKDFSEYEAKFTQQNIYNKAASEALDGTPFVLAFEGIAPTELYTATMGSRVSLGGQMNGTLTSLLAGVPTSEKRRMAAAIENGFNRGLTNQQIVRSIFNNQNGGSESSKSRSAIDSIVRTATNSMGQQASRLTAEQNSDLVRGYRNLATYDSRLSAICGSIAAQFGDKVLPNYNDFPATPRHLRCRSLIIMVLKNWSDILTSGKVQIEDEQGDQAFFAAPTRESSAQLTKRLRKQGLTTEQITKFKQSFSGQTSANTLDGFLSEQSKRGNTKFLNTFFQSEERARLYSSGEIPLKDLYSYENKSFIPLNDLVENQL